MKKILFLFFVLSFLSLFIFFPAHKTQAQEINFKPSITDFNQRSAENLLRPIVSGTTNSNTLVFVYIDYNLYGLAATSTSENGQINFSFQPEQNLAYGVHKMKIISQDATTKILSQPTTEIVFSVTAPMAPTLIEPNSYTATSQEKPTITGVTLSGTKALIYIDGQYSGETNLVNHDSGAANFSYNPTANLNKGDHVMQAVAQDNNGQQSSLSNPVFFTIQDKQPSPIIISDTSVIRVEEGKRAIIDGLIINNSELNVYVDGVLNGKIKIAEDGVETASFAYQTFQPLTKGKHIVYTTSIDHRGKESPKSNIVYLEAKKRSPRITLVAAEENISGSSQYVSSESENKEPEPTSNKASEIANETKEAETVDKTISATVDNAFSQEEQEKNENSQDSEIKWYKKININLVIFILFLIGVGIWIYWVNKELIKEKKQENKAQSNKNKDESDEKEKNEQQKLDL